MFSSLFSTKVSVVLNLKNPDKDQVTRMQIRFPNQNNRLWVSARYFFVFGMRIGLVVKYE